jgi:hypothetical protein
MGEASRSNVAILVTLGQACLEEKKQAWLFGLVCS